MSVKSICGVILKARDPHALAAFYGEALGLHFEREDHGGLQVHFGVDIGEVHFGIHPPANLADDTVGNAATSIAFNVASLPEACRRLDELGAQQVIAPHDEGFGQVASYRDPEGNLLEVVELDYDFGSAGADRA